MKEDFQLTKKIIASPLELQPFVNQLKELGLPHDDLDYKKNIFISYFHEEELIGTGGLEIYGETSLLRSLSVKKNYQKRNFGSFITKDILKLARKKGITFVYLLTETAADFFKKEGFVEIQRNAVPDKIKSSKEYSMICPSSSAVMFIQTS